MKQLINRKADLLILIFITIIGCIYSIIAIASHNHFETFGWDLGFFDQIIWKASKGDLIAYSTLAKENLLADHFQVVLYFLAPLYLVWSNVRMLLIAQAFLVVFAAYPLFILAKSITKNLIFSLAIVISYLVFIGTQWTILNEFHQMAFTPIFLSTAFYALHTQKRWLYLGGIIGLLITKEELGLLVFGIGMVAWLVYKQKKLGIQTAVLGIVSFFLLIYKIMPIFSVTGTYSHPGFGEAGYMPTDVVINVVTNPIFLIKSMVYPAVKIKTVFDSFFAFGFLPLFQPLLLVPTIIHFVSRFIYAGPQFTKWANVNHHAAPLGILLSVSSIYAGAIIINFISRKNKMKKSALYIILGIYLFTMAAIQDILLHGPIHSIVKKELFMKGEWMKDNKDVIEKVPKAVPIAAQNNLFPHLSQRKKIYLLPEIEDAEYIVVDFHDGPNKFSPLDLTGMQKFVNNLITDKKFSILYQKGDAMLLKRTAKEFIVQ